MRAASMLCVSVLALALPAFGQDPPNCAALGEAETKLAELKAQRVVCEDGRAGGSEGADKVAPPGATPFFQPTSAPAP